MGPSKLQQSLHHPRKNNHAPPHKMLSKATISGLRVLPRPRYRPYSGHGKAPEIKSLQGQKSIERKSALRQYPIVIKCKESRCQGDGVRRQDVGDREGGAGAAMQFIKVARKKRPVRIVRELKRRRARSAGREVRRVVCRVIIVFVKFSRPA